MKVQMIAPTPFFAHRGCHVRILEEVRAVAEAGHEVALCTYGLGDDVAGVHTVRAPRVPWYRKLSAGPSWHKLYLDGLLFLTSLRFARRFRPDVIHAHLHEGVFLAKPIARLLGGIPVLGDLQGSLTVETSDHGFFEGWSWGERLFARLETRLNRAADEIVASAVPMLAGIRKDRGEDRNGVWFLGDGVDAAVFRTDPERRRAVRERLGYREDEPVIAYLGLLTPYQGLDVLCQSAVRVLRAVPEARFLIMGFPNEDHYRARAAALGIAGRTQFTGRIRYEDAPDYLGAADLAVSAKLSTTEANGKLLNYMAMGLPTVAFDTQVNREILGDLGVYARLGDEEDLAERLIDLIRDTPRRRALAGELRRRAVERHSWQTRGRQFTEIYQRMARRHTGEATLQES